MRYFDLDCEFCVKCISLENKKFFLGGDIDFLRGSRYCREYRLFVGFVCGFRLEI